MVVDVVEEEDAATSSNNIPKDTATSSSKAVEEVEADLAIRVAVSVDEAEAMSNTTNKVAVMAAPLQPTRLDSQDGMDISM